MWIRVPEAARALLLILLWSAVSGCSSTSESEGAPEATGGEKNEPGIFEAVPSQGPGGNMGRESDPDQLFIQLDRQLRNSRDPGTSAVAVVKMRPILNRYVDSNFDMVDRAIRGKNNRHRLVAAWALGYSTNPRALPLLLGILNDPSPRIRCNALYSIANLGDPDTPLPLLVARFADEDPSVRVNAARAVRDTLPRGGGLEALVPLTGLMADEDGRVRLAAVAALGQMARPECVGYLVNALGDEKPLVRAQAALALAKSRDPEAVHHLINALKHEKNPTAGHSLVKSLERLTGQHFQKRSEWLIWWQESQKND